MRRRTRRGADLHLEEDEERDKEGEVARLWTWRVVMVMAMTEMIHDHC